MPPRLTPRAAKGRLIALVAVCIAIATLASAQETINQGTIAGRVFDPQRAAVPGAIVSVRHSDTNVTIQATTDADGRFRFSYLRIGQYELTVRFEGFRTNSRRLTLPLG